MPVDIDSIQSWTAIISTIVACLTGFFIVQTFKLQAKTMVDQSIALEKQSKLIALQMDSIYKEKYPVFRAMQTQRVDNGYIVFSLECELIKGDVHSYHSNIIGNNEAFIELFEFEKYTSQIIRGFVEGTKIIIKYRGHQDAIKEFLKVGKDSDLRFSVNFYYSDIVGTFYQQEIGVIYNRDPFVYPAIMPGRTHLIDKRYHKKKVDRSFYPKIEETNVVITDKFNV
ncbi:hypothetical protein [Pedobacter ginsengisoli]|uniref:hypothetical protein n=1 Tax=Pedobacter ginsengisoli TaxID=363852 RepID=UPI00254DE359|nr:hypothetical protein [Pedobacter ginsengisoli]